MVNATTKICEQALATLITCTRRRTRPLSLVAVADHLNTAVQCFETVEAVAEKIGLSPSMLRRFRLVERLEPTLKALVADRQIDSIDSVAELGSLDHETQRALALILPLESLDTEDIRGCVRLLNRNPKMPISEVIEKVRTSKTVQVFVYEFVVKESMREEGTIERNVLKVLSVDEFAGVEVGSATGRLKVFKRGRARISLNAKSKKLSIQNFVQILCEGNV